MGMYDIFDEMSRANDRKTETGDEKISGVLVGVVAENYDKTMPGRLCVNIPVRDTDANQLKWAKLAMPSSGPSWGQYFMPEKGDQVLLVFECGNIEKPFVIGCIPRDKDTFIKKAYTEKNELKQIKTRNGNSISFYDDEKDTAEKDRIHIETGKEMLQVTLNNEKKKVSIQNKEATCKIVMSTEDGKIEMETEKKMSIKVGDVELLMNGSSGAVQVKAKKITLKAESNMELASDGIMKISGKQTMIQGASVVKMSSDGAMNIKANTISM